MSTRVTVFAAAALFAVNAAAQDIGRVTKVTLYPGSATVELSSADLESGNAGKGLFGQLGDGTGKWRLHIVAPVALPIVSLLRDPNGNLTNLSSDPEGESSVLPQ